MEVVRARGSLWKWSGLVARYGSDQGSWLVMEVVRARGSLWKWSGLVARYGSGQDS